MPIAGMLTPRARASALYLRDSHIIVVAGGEVQDAVNCGKAELYKVAMNKWMPLPSLNNIQPNYDASLVTFNRDILYYIGGAKSRTVEMLDITQTGGW